MEKWTKNRIGLDECGNCWAGQQKYYTSPFQLMEKGPAPTLYQKDFVKHPIEKAPKIKNDFYTTFNIEEPIDFGTTMAVINNCGIEV